MLAEFVKSMSAKVLHRREYFPLDELDRRNKKANAQIKFSVFVHLIVIFVFLHTEASYCLEFLHIHMFSRNDCFVAETMQRYRFCWEKDWCDGFPAVIFVTRLFIGARQ